MILTLTLDATSATFFSDVRRRYFPAELNFLDAHVTLFHALPDPEIEAIAAQIERSLVRCFPVAVTGLRSLGRGVAFQLESAELMALRRTVADAWWEWLTPQDRQKFQPHITVQNKVAPEIARATLEALKAANYPRVVEAQGLRLWEYRNGPWALLRDFPFRDAGGLG